MINMFQVGDRVRIRSERDLINEYGESCIGMFDINRDMREKQLGTVGIIAKADNSEMLPFLVRSPESKWDRERETGWWYSADELYKEEK